MKDRYEGMIEEDPNRAQWMYDPLVSSFGPGWQGAYELADPGSLRSQFKNIQLAQEEAFKQKVGRYPFSAGSGPGMGAAMGTTAGAPASAAAAAPAAATAGKAGAAMAGTGFGLNAGTMSWALPAALSALGLVFGRPKDTLDPRQQALMNQALQMQNSRMLLQNPLFEMITQGAMSRQPASARMSAYQLPNLLGTAGAGRAPTADAIQNVGRAVRRPTNYRA